MIYHMSRTETSQWNNQDAVREKDNQTGFNKKDARSLILAIAMDRGCTSIVDWHGHERWRR